MKSQKDLHSLFIKYLNRECTTSEIKYLLATFDEAENEDALKDAIKQYLEQTQLNEDADDAAIQSSLDEVHANLIHNIRTSSKASTPVYRFLWLKAAAAILILGTLTTGIYSYMRHNNLQSHDPKMTANEIINDAQPGGNKAILTLSNGSKIVLNDVKKGVIARQGAMAVIKTKEGQLVNSTAVPLPGNKDVKPVYYTISTPRGGEYQVILPDGSKVWLNAASSLKYPAEFTGGERDVELTGEAYFEVAKNAAMPFKVAAAGQTVQVLGTHFNINAYTDEKAIKTTLLEGSIQITYQQAKAMIKPGEQAQVVVGSTNPITVLNDPEAEDAIAWKEGYLQFNHDDIQTVMRQVSRWYDVSIKYEGQISSKQYGGAIQKNLKLSQVLGILENNHLHFILSGKEVTVMP